MTPVSIQGPRPVVAPATTSPAPQTAATRGENGALLPPADMPAQKETLSVLAQLYKIMSASNEQQQTEGEKDVEFNRNLQKATEVDEKHQIELAKKAAEEQADANKGPMDWVCDDIGVVGAAGLCTFNYPLVIADVAVHKLGLVENLKIDAVDAACAFALQYGHPELLVADLVVRHPEILPGELHDKIASVASFGKSLDAGPSVSDQDVKPYSKQLLAANLVVASAALTVCTLGAASPLATGLAIAAIACSVAAYTAENVEPVHDLMEKNLGKETTGHVILGLQIGSAALSLASGGLTIYETAGKAAAASNVVKVAKGIKAGMEIGQGALQVEAGIRGLRAAEAQHDVDEAHIRMKAAQNQRQQLERAVEMIIDGMKDAHESGKRSLETLQNTMQIQDQTPVQISGAMKA